MMFQATFLPMPLFQGRQVVTYITSKTSYSSDVIGWFRSHSRNLGTRTDSWASRYVFISTEKAALREIGPHFTLKLGSPRTEFFAAKEFGEPSAKLEFDEFDDIAAGGGR